MSTAAEERRKLRGALIFGVVLLIFALYILYDATQIRQGGGFTIVGPQVFPLVTAVILAILAVIMILRATVWPDGELAEHSETESRGTHWQTVGIIITMLVVYPIAMGYLGYVLVTTVFVPAIAATLGSTKHWRDLAVGVGLAVIVYIVFTRFLGVRLPAGILPF